MARRRWTRDPWTVIVAALASYRITRLVTADHLPPMQKLRDTLTEKTPAGYDILWTCPWCCGWWVSLALTGAAELADRHGHRDAFLLAAMPWAVSTVAGLLAEHEVS
jgi:hypothetical protein